MATKCDWEVFFACLKTIVCPGTAECLSMYVIGIGIEKSMTPRTPTQDQYRGTF